MQRNLNFWKYLCSREANIYRLTWFLGRLGRSTWQTLPHPSLLSSWKWWNGGCQGFDWQWCWRNCQRCWSPILCQSGCGTYCHNDSVIIGIVAKRISVTVDVTNTKKMTTRVRRRSNLCLRLDRESLYRVVINTLVKDAKKAKVIILFFFLKANRSNK